MTASTPPDSLPQLTADVRAIVTEVEQLTGRKSTWSGQVVIGTELNIIGRPAYFGAKAWNCNIVIHQGRIGHIGRYSTLIHETFHSISAGLNPPDFDLWKGYEEGVVEACTRLFRDAILSAVGLPPARDVRASYDPEIATLEALRVRTQRASADFYLVMLATPLLDREEVVLQ